ncbi:MAG TPA: hypothetical protein VHQ01_10555, partial [Pyrinomonadaceae bacterium]|nr:hypothetical protein [Pyrinomonadaceae bacterium]
MGRYSYILFLVIVLGSSVLAQDVGVTPTPTPLPTPLATPPVITTPTPVAVLPPVNDTQKVRPEDLRGVPQVAVNYTAPVSGLPDLGRVGVN